MRGKSTYGSIVEAVAANAQLNPDKIAIISNDNHYSYGRLWNDIRILAGDLLKADISIGDKVVLRASNSYCYLANLLSIHLIGAVAVPVEKNVPVNRIKEICDELKASMIISDVYPEETDCPKRSENRLNNLDESDTWKGDFPDREWLGDILFTTGTTGRSKGVMLSHKAIVAVTENIMDYAKMAKDEIELIPLPLNHTHGLRRCYTNLYNGSTLVLISGLSPFKPFYDALEINKITAFSITPLMFSMIRRIMGDKLLDYKNQIRYVQFGASATPEIEKQEARRLLPNSRLYNVYGATEAGATVAYDFNVDGMKASCIGKPTKHTNVFFANNEREKFNATKDNPGFISIDSDVNMIGYWNAPELSKEVMNDGLYYSKDLGYMDADGDVFFLGRADDVINIGGIKISPLEIEEVVLRRKEIKECICTTQEDENMGTVLMLGVVMNEGSSFDKKVIEKYLKDNLEPSRVPKVIKEIDKVPRSYNDKILRNKGIV